MESRSFVYSRQIRVIAAALLLVAGGPMAGWAASGEPAGGGSVEGVATIATGSDQNVDGFLSVSPDDFGAWASLAGFTGGGDIYNPVGAAAPLEPTFSSATFLFLPGRSERIVLTENASHLAIADDFSLSLTVDSASVASDSNGDTVDDTLVSAFSATGAGSDTNLGFDLTQVVSSGDPGVAMIDQTYVITNNGPTSVDIGCATVYDGDLLWEGAPGNEFANDQVGTTWNADGGDLFVFQQEPGDTVGTSITLSSPQATAYFGGKNGVQPAGGPPPYNFGTDTEVFDAFGVPMTWLNHIAGIGYDTDGVSGTNPPGSTAPEDAFIGLSMGSITLGPGESTTLEVRFTYGQDFPTQPPMPFEPIVEVPTLGGFGLASLAAIIALAGGMFLRRRRSA